MLEKIYGWLHFSFNPTDLITIVWDNYYTTTSEWPRRRIACIAWSLLLIPRCLWYKAWHCWPHEVGKQTAMGSNVAASTASMNLPLSSPRWPWWPSMLSGIMMGGVALLVQQRRLVVLGTSYNLPKATEDRWRRPHQCCSHKQHDTHTS